MRSIRRLLDRNFSGVFVATVSLVTGGAVASCGSDDDVPAIATQDDAGADGPLGDAAGLDDDASADGSSPGDAAPFDGGPRAVVCTSPPCAVSLVGALGSSDSDRSEAYCALLDDGAVACWGANNAGQLGRGPDAGAADSARAQRVVDLPEMALLDHTCGIDKSGSVWCWGTGPFLTNDAGTVTTQRTPVKLPLPAVKSVAVGPDVGCASIDDDVVCWGRNTNGLIASFNSVSSSAVLLPQRVAVPAGAPIRGLRVSKAAFALRHDGVTVSWGANPPLARTSSLGPDPNPLPIPLAGISSMDLTSDNACAIAGGVGYCWGRANILPSPPFDRVVPEPVSTPEPVVQIATARSVRTAALGDSFVQPQRWCAVGASGSVYCYGYNGGGQAGDGTKEHAYEPVKVQLPEKAVQVSAFPDSTCALLVNGKVYCWGTNYYGQLGNGKMREPSLVPQEVVLP